jgi:hypothetical protein
VSRSDDAIARAAILAAQGSLRVTAEAVLRDGLAVEYSSDAEGAAWRYTEGLVLLSGATAEERWTKWFETSWARRRIGARPGWMTESDWLDSLRRESITDPELARAMAADAEQRQHWDDLVRAADRAAVTIREDHGGRETIVRLAHDVTATFKRSADEAKFAADPNVLRRRSDS